MTWSKEKLKEFSGQHVTIIQRGDYFQKDSLWRDTGILHSVNDKTFSIKLTQGKDAGTIKARPIDIVVDVEIEEGDSDE